MAPRATRSRGAAVSEPAAATVSSSKYTLPAESGEPPKLFILPKQATADARIVTLPHPRYATRPTRYLVCPETGMYEFTQIASPATMPRSWLVEGKTAVAGEEESEAKSQPPSSPPEAAAAAAAAVFPSLITKSADLYVASPVDPLFLVLPALAASSSSSSSSSSSPSTSSSSSPKRMFLAADDHLDALPLQDSHLADLLGRQPRVRRLLEARMAAVCDTVEAGDEPMFRLNEGRLLRELLGKARRMATRLPRSLEERFVAKVLEAPVLGIRRADTGSGGTGAEMVTGKGTSASKPASPTPAPSTPATDSADSVDSQSSSATDATSATAATTATEMSAAAASATATATATAQDPAVRTAMQAPDDVVALQRLRVALDYICSSYVPPALTAALKEKLASSSSSSSSSRTAADSDLPDFGPLDAYLGRLAAVRQEVARARSAALDYSHKRGLDEDEDEEERAEKRRKHEEEERRRKASVSRGVRDLKKVNVSGMKKLSEFFKKK